METIKDYIVGIAPSIGNIIAVFILFGMAVGGCQTKHCCPQCRANANDCNLLNEDIKVLEREVRDMKRGYRTVPVTVCITNAWDVKTN